MSQQSPKTPFTKRNFWKTNTDTAFTRESWAVIRESCSWSQRFSQQDLKPNLMPLSSTHRIVTTARNG